MKKRALGIFALFAACLAACSPPQYTRYTSVSGDFSVEAPWGWNVIAEADHDAFSEVKFIGPFDADFFLGAPSLSVRWYKRYRAHSLRGGGLEMYADADDFINQTLKQVYGPESVIMDGTKILDKKLPIPEVTLRESGLQAKFFGVISPAPAGPNQIGAVKDDKGRWFNIRYHEYAVIPTDGGFYVITYPATQKGHNKAVDRFVIMIQSFHPYTAGPGGEKIKVRPAAFQR
jgi:hypothetical protein